VCEENGWGLIGPPKRNFMFLSGHFMTWFLEKLPCEDSSAALPDFRTRYESFVAIWSTLSRIIGRFVFRGSWPIKPGLAKRSFGEFSRVTTDARKLRQIDGCGTRAKLSTRPLFNEAWKFGVGLRSGSFQIRCSRWTLAIIKYARFVGEITIFMSSHKICRRFVANFRLHSRVHFRVHFGIPRPEYLFQTIVAHPSPLMCVQRRQFKVDSIFFLCWFQDGCSTSCHLM
jgi:hypothetical protein